MASESKPMDIEEEVPEIEDEIKKPEDEGRVPAAERELEYQREVDAEDLEAPDIFATYRKETLPIFETRKISNPFKRDKKRKKKIGKLTWEDDIKTIADNIREEKDKKPEYSANEKHQMDNSDTSKYSFYKSMLEFHDKIRGDPDSEETPIGAQPTGGGRRGSPAAPFKQPKGRKVGQVQSLVSGKKSPFGKRGSKGTTGRGVKQRQKPTVSPSANPSGGMAGLASQYQPKVQVKPNPAGLGSPFAQQVGHKKVPKRAPAKPVKDRSQGEAQAVQQPTNAGSTGQALQSPNENRKLPDRKSMGKKEWKKYQKKIQQQKRESVGRGSQQNPKPASGETYRKQQAAEAADKKRGKKLGLGDKGVPRPSSGSGAPKIAAMIKAWYSEIYGI